MAILPKERKERNHRQYWVKISESRSSVCPKRFQQGAAGHCEQQQPSGVTNEMPQIPTSARVKSFAVPALKNAAPLHSSSVENETSNK